MNFEPSTHQTHSLLHAPQSEPLSIANFFHIESFTVVRDRQVKCAIESLELHLCVCRSTVFLHVAESFLDDAKQAQRNVRRHGARHFLVGEYNLDSSLSGEFLAECRNSRSQAKPLECRRMQPVRQGMQIGTKLAGGVHKLMQLPICFRWGLGNNFSSCFQSERQHS